MKQSIVLMGLVAIFMIGTVGWCDPVFAGRRPLDLPVDHAGSDDVEDETEQVITFFGYEYEGDSFYWCLDRSYSMVGRKLATLKEEMYASLDQLSPRSEFGIVSFSHDVNALAYRPLQASMANKKRARRYVHDLRATASTDLALGMSLTLTLSEKSKRQDRQIILVGDGMPNSVFDALEAIDTRNTSETPIHTLYISNDDSGKDLFKEIALLNGGTFRAIEL